MRHDDHEVRVSLVHGLAEGGEIGPVRGPPGRVGQIKQQTVARADQLRVTERKLFVIAGQQLVVDAAVPVVLVQEHLGGGGTAAARGAVQDDGAGLGEGGTGRTHVAGRHQHSS